MRRKNFRAVVVGALLAVLAAAFFEGMTTLAPRSNDPVAMMRTVGQVAGFVASLGGVMIVFGLIGRKPRQ